MIKSIRINGTVLVILGFLAFAAIVICNIDDGHTANEVRIDILKPGQQIELMVECLEDALLVKLQYQKGIYPLDFPPPNIGSLAIVFFEYRTRGIGDDLEYGN